MVEDFLWHHVSEQEKKEIQKQAKQIMESFSRKLVKLDKEMQDASIERGEGFRDEGSGSEEDSDFRERMFGNAPHRAGDFILGEKKKW